MQCHIPEWDVAFHAWDIGPSMQASVAAMPADYFHFFILIRKSWLLLTHPFSDLKMFNLIARHPFSNRSILTLLGMTQENFLLW